eukprot:scaffold180793_cov32-Tisochrysis_lutea.AAC.1
MAALWRRASALATGIPRLRVHRSYFRELIITRTQIDLRVASLVDFLQEQGNWSRNGEQLALHCATSGQAVRYDELFGRINGAAHALRSCGFQQGDVLNIHLHNSVEYVISFLAAASLGGTITTSNPAYTATELGFQYADSGATIALTSELYRGVVEEAMAMPGSRVRAVAYIEDLSSFPHAPAMAEPIRLSRPISPLNDLVALPYSSGTTGKPKGVCLTHQNLVANIQQSTMDKSCNLGITENDKLVAILPFFHIYGLTVLMCAALAERASLVILPKFEPATFLQTLQDHHITQAYVAPPLCVFLSKHPMVADYNLSTLREIFSGAAPLDASMQISLREQLGVVVRQGYGMTETSPIISFAPAQPEKIMPGSAGLLAPNTSMKVVDENGIELGPNEEGELLISGPQVMRGYLNRPEATEATLMRDGFIRTGDLARVSVDGNIFIGDRVKELIKVKGFQVAPAELEGLLLSHPHVADACVVGIKDDYAGELPKAFVVRREGAQPDQESILSFLRPQLAQYKWPATVEFVESIPKSASGKILRRVLKG